MHFLTSRFNVFIFLYAFVKKPQILCTLFSDRYPLMIPYKVDVLINTFNSMMFNLRTSLFFILKDIFSTYAVMIRRFHLYALWINHLTSCLWNFAETPTHDQGEVILFMTSCFFCRFQHLCGFGLWQSDSNMSQFEFFRFMPTYTSWASWICSSFSVLFLRCSQLFFFSFLLMWITYLNILRIMFLKVYLKIVLKNNFVLMWNSCFFWCKMQIEYHYA